MGMADQSMEARYERAWVKMIGRRYLTAFEKAVLDPKLVSMRQELALLDSRIAELKEREQRGESRGQWEKVLRLTAHLGRIVEKQADARDEPPDLTAIQNATGELFELARATVSDYEIWDEIKDLIERRRRIASSERKYEEMEQKLIPITHLVLMFDKLREAIDAVIPDRGMQLQLIQEVRVRCNGEPNDPKSRIPLVLPTSYLALHSADEVFAGDASVPMGDVEDCPSGDQGSSSGAT